MFTSDVYIILGIFMVLGGIYNFIVFMWEGQEQEAMDSEGGEGTPNAFAMSMWMGQD